MEMLEEYEPEIYDKLRNVIDMKKLSVRAVLAHRVICKINRDWNR